ncbi:MAG TPA: alpha-amylase family glycosyl hydrolase, partial [Thermoanaerobaculia bacterium]
MVQAKIARWSLAVVLLATAGCGSADAYAARQRAVRTAPPAWDHEWARGAVFYEIFVRSFADSDGDGIGDFNGLTSKLDYLNDGNPATTTDLGIDGIWLMPAFESSSYHGYDTIDYARIERDYGTNEDFRRFLDEAHRRGIRVILDFVINHTGIDHPWFIESASSTASPKRNWYVWSATDPGWRQPWGGSDPSWHLRNGAWYYGAFWSGMPDLNFRNRETKAEIFRLARHWIQSGADGYRLDATRYLVEDGPGERGQADTPETHAVLRELSDEVRRANPRALLIAENTVKTPALAQYFASVPMNFNFPLAEAIVKGVDEKSAERVKAVLRDMSALYPPNIIDVPFITNHDQIRVATVFRNDAAKLRSASAILLTLPGLPFIYYGEELGLQNGPSNADEWKRTPMPWTPAGGFTVGTPWHAFAPGVGQANVAAQTADRSSLLSHYRDLIRARKSS